MNIYIYPQPTNQPTNQPINHRSRPAPQVGNAVSPAVAAALGRCLALAALGESPPGEPVVPAPCAAYDALVAEWRAARPEAERPFFYEACADAGLEVPVATWIISLGGGAGGKASSGAGTTAEEGEDEEEEDEEEDEGPEEEDDA